MIIQHAIRLYFRSLFSFCEAEDLLAEPAPRFLTKPFALTAAFGPMIAADLRNRRPRPASALSDQSPDRKEFAPIQKLGKHVLIGKAGPLFRVML
jgi:hypothetical protein